MTCNQAKALFNAISDALSHDCADMALALSTLGTLMCVDPNAELWARIEDIGGFKLAA